MASRSQGLSISWQPSSKLNILPGRLFLLLSHLSLHFRYTAPKPCYFFGSADSLSSHSSPLHCDYHDTCHTYLHTSYKVLFPQSLELNLDLFLVDLHPVCIDLNNFLYSLGSQIRIEKNDSGSEIFRLVLDLSACHYVKAIQDSCI